MKETRNTRPGLIITTDSTDYAYVKAMSGLWVIYKIYSEGLKARRDLPYHCQFVEKEAQDCWNEQD